MIDGPKKISLQCPPAFLQKMFLTDNGVNGCVGENVGANDVRALSLSPSSTFLGSFSSSSFFFFLVSKK